MGTAPQGHLSTFGCFHLVLNTFSTTDQHWATMECAPAEQLCSLAPHPQDTEPGQC